MGLSMFFKQLLVVVLVDDFELVFEGVFEEWGVFECFDDFDCWVVCGEEVQMNDVGLD